MTSPAHLAATVESALRLDERVRDGNAGPLDALDELVARIEALTQERNALRESGRAWAVNIRGKEQRIAALTQERDEQARAAMENYDLWVKRDGEAEAAEAALADTRRALEQARDYCARPPGVCFDPALAAGERTAPGEEQPSQEWLDAQHDPTHHLYGLSWAKARRALATGEGTEGGCLSGRKGRGANPEHLRGAVGSNPTPPVEEPEDAAFERALLRADIKAGNPEAAEAQLERVKRLAAGEGTGEEQ